MVETIYALAEKRKELADGTPVRTPLELQIGWLVERHGPLVLGMPPDFKFLVKITRAVDIYSAFRKHIKERDETDWRIIRDTLAIVEGWKNP